jgi:hypothetical protein
MAEGDPIRIRRHTTERIPDAGSYGVHFADGREPVYFYWDDNASRRAIIGCDDSASALEKARQFARTANNR